MKSSSPQRGSSRRRLQILNVCQLSATLYPFFHLLHTSAFFGACYSALVFTPCQISKQVSVNLNDLSRAATKALDSLYYDFASGANSEPFFTYCMFNSTALQQFRVLQNSERISCLSDLQQRIRVGNEQDLSVVSPTTERPYPTFRQKPDINIDSPPPSDSKPDQKDST